MVDLPVKRRLFPGHTGLLPGCLGMACSTDFIDRLSQEKPALCRMRAVAVTASAGCNRGMNIFSSKLLLLMAGKTEVRGIGMKQFFLFRAVAYDMTDTTIPAGQRCMDHGIIKLLFIVAVIAEPG
jgi:hypothetical protein